MSEPIDAGRPSSTEAGIPGRSENIASVVDGQLEDISPKKEPIAAGPTVDFSSSSPHAFDSSISVPTDPDREVLDVHNERGGEERTGELDRKILDLTQPYTDVYTRMLPRIGLGIRSVRRTDQVTYSDVEMEYKTRIEYSAGLGDKRLRRVNLYMENNTEGGKGSEMELEFDGESMTSLELRMERDSQFLMNLEEMLRRLYPNRSRDMGALRLKLNLGIKKGIEIVDQSSGWNKFWSIMYLDPTSNDTRKYTYSWDPEDGAFESQGDECTPGEFLLLTKSLLDLIPTLAVNKVLL